MERIRGEVMQGHGWNIIVQHPNIFYAILKAPAALVELSPVYHLSPRLLLLTSCALFFESLLAMHMYLLSSDSSLFVSRNATRED